MSIFPLSIVPLTRLGAGLCLLPLVLHSGEQPYPMQDWVPPTAAQWTSLGGRMQAALEQASKKDLKPSGGTYLAPMVSVDRTNGRLYAFPQSGALWVSMDRGQSFAWLNREVASWGFNESPTSMCVSPEGSKLRIFSSNRSGFSVDGGTTWKYMNFTINFGFEDGLINWDGKGDGTMIVARSHTWPQPRMWLSRDAGASFSEYSPEITKQINTQNMALMDGDVLLFQGDKLVRSEDYAKTLQEVPMPASGGRTGRFIGLSRRFKDKVYWLSEFGVHTSADRGLTWTMVGTPFPAEKKSGPLFGRDENHMLVLCADTVVETLDGGRTWHELAKLPVRLDHHPWSHSFAYDPIGDVLYCNSRGHSGGPYLFGRLALKRWGDIEKTPPSAPAGIEASVGRGGNSAALRWKPSSDASGIYAYYIYIDGVLQYRTEKPEIVLANCAWQQELKVGVQAVDPWQNRSAVVEQAVRLVARPAEVTLLQDLQPASATVDGAALALVSDAADDKAAPLTIRMEAFEPNPVPQHAPRKLSCGVGIRVKNTHKQGVLEYAVDGKYSRLVIDAGMRNSGWNSVQLRILLDGKEAAVTKPVDYETAISGVGRKPEAYDLDLSNVQRLRFEFTTIGDTRYWTDDVLVLGNAMLFARK